MQRYIYILRDPQTKEPRYVGQTNDVRRRYNQHRRPGSGKRLSNFDLWYWLDSLKHRGLDVLMDVVAVVDFRQAQQAERTWIHRLECQGYELLNQKLTKNKGDAVAMHAIAYNDHFYLQEGQHGRQVVAYHPEVTSVSKDRADLVAQIRSRINGLKDMLEKLDELDGVSK